MQTKFGDSIYHEILKDDLATIQNGVQDLDLHFDESLRFILAIPEDMSSFAYGSGKWTLSEVIGHLLDARIVFLNRLMYVVREEKVPLLSFDEQLWTQNSGYKEISITQLAAIYESGSRLIRAMVKVLPEGALERVGVANNIEITAEEILLYLIAHEKHHFKVIQERYLKN